MINTFHFSLIFLSVNFKKNEKVYNPEKSEVLKALQENDSEPEPGNDDDKNEPSLINDDFTHRHAINNLL